MRITLKTPPFWFGHPSLKQIAGAGLCNSPCRPSVRRSVCSTRYQLPWDLKLGTHLELVLFTPETIMQMFRTQTVQNGGHIKIAATSVKADCGRAGWDIMTICDENQVFKAALHYLPSTEDQLPILYFKHLLNNFLKKLADIAEFKFHNEKRACEGSNLIDNKRWSDSPKHRWSGSVRPLTTESPKPKSLYIGKICSGLRSLQTGSMTVTGYFKSTTIC